MQQITYDHFSDNLVQILFTCWWRWISPCLVHGEMGIVLIQGAFQDPRVPHFHELKKSRKTGIRNSLVWDYCQTRHQDGNFFLKHESCVSIPKQKHIWFRGKSKECIGLLLLLIFDQGSKVDEIQLKLNSCEYKRVKIWYPSLKHKRSSTPSEHNLRCGSPKTVCVLPRRHTWEMF